MMALFAVMVGFASANQDIVIDAWRIEAADKDRQGPMAAAYQWGYRISMVVAGVAPLLLADFVSWEFSYGVMAALMLVGVAAVFAAPREAQHSVRAVDLGGAVTRPLPEALEWLVRGVIVLGGALLLGVDGVCVIGHGSSKALSVLSALRLSHSAASHGVMANLHALSKTGSPNEPVACE
jgi:PAT family beta-lactamase induction signal transducer AmpG